MKIAVPSENANGLASMRSGHFGHAPFLTIVELDDDKNIVSVESIKNAEHGEGGCGNVIEYVLGLGLDGILAAGMGMPPLMRFTQGGMTVYFCWKSRRTFSPLPFSVSIQPVSVKSPVELQMVS